MGKHRGICLGAAAGDSGFVFGFASCEVGVFLGVWRGILLARLDKCALYMIIKRVKIGFISLESGERRFYFKISIFDHRSTDR